MDSRVATILLAAVRASGDQLMSALYRVEREASPQEAERWRTAVGRAMTAMYSELLEPICEENPEVVPKSLGGQAPDS